jgi:hypothetical protein
MAVNDRTPNLSLALPSIENIMSLEDVPRLREALGAIDAALHSLQLSLAGKADVSAIAAAVASVVNGAPGALDQLNELATAIGNDANFSTTILTALSGKLSNLPATTTRLGGIKVGAGFVVDLDGMLSVVASGGGSGLPTYTDIYIVPGSTTNTITVSGGYNPGQIDVWLNGVTVYDGGDDYTATNGTSIVFTDTVNTTDKIKVRRWAYLPADQAVNKTGDTLTGALNEAPPVSVASAGVLNIGVLTSNNLTITGTTAITSLGSYAAGAKRTVTFAGELVLTHNATSLILPSAANITTAEGDVAEMLSLGSGNWRCIGYMRASGQSVAAASGPRPYTDIAVNAAATRFARYRLTASLTLTLPPSPADGDWVGVFNNSGTTTPIVSGNGQNINGLPEAFVIDRDWASLDFVFRTGYGWMTV